MDYYDKLNVNSITDSALFSEKILSKNPKTLLLEKREIPIHYTKINKTFKNFSST